MTWNSWHMGGIERKAIAQGFSFYSPIRYSVEGNLRVCPGHEGTSTLDVERAHNPFVREALR